MRIKRQLKVVHKLEQEIRITFNEAREYHLTFDQLLKRLRRRVGDNPDYGKLPKYRKHGLRKYRDAMFDVLTDHALEWKVRLDGKLLSCSDVPDGRWADVRTGAQVYNGTSDIFSDGA